MKQVQHVYQLANSGGSNTEIGASLTFTVFPEMRMFSSLM